MASCSSSVDGSCECSIVCLQPSAPSLYMVTASALYDYGAIEKTRSWLGKMINRDISYTSNPQAGAIDGQYDSYPSSLHSPAIIYLFYYESLSSS